MSDENEKRDYNDLFEKKRDGLFIAKQSYESEPARTIYCKLCGGKDFNVGSGDYLTVIRCVKCQHEFAVHDG